jgi:hypothetical protein
MSKISSTVRNLLTTNLETNVLKFIAAVGIGYKILGAIIAFSEGKPAVVEFTYKGVAYKATVERL